jgi:tRNA nucleotidyltransferase (CCA-adding enzyme)
MKTYRVGGCVRDRLLDLPITDIDWIITGATVDQMKSAGYQPVGKDFPVFLHPKTKQEYALARNERKMGPGYHGFEFNTDPTITIEQDLSRRDLTINAIAEDKHGNLVDPYGGQTDLKNHTLRHVSDAFSEDPVRVLRIARFAARFHHLGFKLAPETIQLIREMGESGELGTLVAERVWSEMSRALGEQNPSIFFETLRQCNALKILFPEIDDLYGVSQIAKYHPEVNTGIHVMMALEKSAELDFDIETRFAVLMHDLGKATTPINSVSGHHRHEQHGVKLVKSFCKQWKVPRAHTELALITTEYHTHVHQAFELQPAILLKLFTKTDVFRKPERFKKMIQACLSNVRGRTDFDNTPYPQADFINQLADKLCNADISKVTQSELEGKALGEAIYNLRLNLIKSEQQALASLQKIKVGIHL